MNGEELEFPDKRKPNAALNDNIDRFTNCLGETAILPEGVCKDNKERIKKEHFLSFKSVTKSFRDHIVNAIFKLN